MERKEITEKWEENRINRETTLAAKLDLRNHYSKKRGALDTMFHLKNYIESNKDKNTLKKMMQPFFEKFNGDMSEIISADGIFCYPEVIIYE